VGGGGGGGGGDGGGGDDDSDAGLSRRGSFRVAPAGSAGGDTTEDMGAADGWTGLEGLAPLRPSRACTPPERGALKACGGTRLRGRAKHVSFAPLPESHGASVSDASRLLFAGLRKRASPLTRSATATLLGEPRAPS